MAIVNIVALQRRAFAFKRRQNFVPSKISCRNFELRSHRPTETKADEHSLSRHSGGFGGEKGASIREKIIL